jgi:Pentapeptide repeats (8 copies)
MGYNLFNIKVCETNDRQEERFLQGEMGMANREQLDILTQGVEAWNQWRKEHPDITYPDLNLATLSYANLNHADLSHATLNHANLSSATLRDADLSSADLNRTMLVETNLTKATLTGCSIYGISVWNVQLEGTTQDNLVITPRGEPTITVDNLEVAQFVYLLLNNPKIRDVIDTIAKKAVLILGRFTPERKAVLDALREALRAHGYLPILFDFDKPSSQDMTETVSTLAHLSRFIIVDLTDPSSAPYEVGMIASNHIRPIQALFQPSDETKRVFAMFPDLVRRYHWVLPPYEYQDQEQLLASLQTKVIEPAEQKAQELEKR